MVCYFTGMFLILVAPVKIQGRAYTTDVFLPALFVARVVDLFFCLLALQCLAAR